MRTITLLIIHCAATREGRDYGVADIDRWHRAQGWKNGCGYHYVVRLDGTVERGRPEAMVGAHCKDHNLHSIGICYIGGCAADGTAADTRTPAQKKSLTALIMELKQRYPKAIVVGHHTLNPHKACPCFDAVHEYINL